MGRAPCCEKMGLKKGPWTSEEDIILINYITQNGHANWRALPKRAGLLRCGKSCRLRWMNYLRPDIKRGNFSSEEEEQIIQLHQQLGNKWSVIAARLPGRTDNEIKNVWHTHLKKKKKMQQPEPEPETQIHVAETPNSPDLSSPRSEVSSLSVAAAAHTAADSFENVAGMDERFWSEILSGDDSGATSDFSSGNSDSQILFSDSFGSDLITEGSMDFWYNLF